MPVLLLLGTALCSFASCLAAFDVLGAWRARVVACRRPPREAPPSEAERRRRCLGELPAMLDVLTLGLAAGLSFDASLELYCERYDGELSRALLESMLAWRMGIRSREAELGKARRRAWGPSLQALCLRGRRVPLLWNAPGGGARAPGRGHQGRAALAG